MLFQIDWLQFTPGTAIAGGALIGLASGALALGAGKIAGISGILGSTLNDLAQRARPAGWRVAFLGGIVAASFIWVLFAPVPGAHYGESWPIITIAGLLVGFGTRMGSGCASGHGVCGLSRLSARSAAAVGTFMAAGIVTAVLSRLF
ncbi:YeeE/YedE family protein [Thiomonas sp. FB-Cd]|uniref:YeeE/YedE family protein n=1 Tax=Thiomonas sp. FB-Cd TaxID=1158292 RepID=UPI0004DF5376|nr:hypothetical protein [Thiomonas sp. FB-Cd]